MNTQAVFRLPIEQRAISSERRFPSRFAKFGPFHLDFERQELFRNGTRLRIPGKVYEVLATLLETPGEVVLRDTLRIRLWPADTHVNFEANVNTTVNKLRWILGDSNDISAYVETIPRKGYSFVAKVEFADRLNAVSLDANAGRRQDSLAARPSPAARLFSPDRAELWLRIGVVTLILGAMLFGAALTLFLHRAP
jgi:DNA-binding winged helix-turn-helix (wHTH) protein